MRAMVRYFSGGRALHVRAATRYAARTAAGSAALGALHVGHHVVARGVVLPVLRPVEREPAAVRTNYRVSLSECINSSLLFHP